MDFFFFFGSLYSYLAVMRAEEGKQHRTTDLAAAEA